MSTDEQCPAPLLVRRAGGAAAEQAAILLCSAGARPAEVAELLRQRCVLVLSDVSLPPAAPPLAAAAYRIDRQAEIADLVAIVVRSSWRRRGLGRRLLTGMLTLLRAEGVDRVQAWALSGSAEASFLVSAGFVVDSYTPDTCGRSHFLLLL